MEGNSISATPIVLYEYAPNGTSSANDSQWQATATHNLSTDPINVIQLATWNIWFDELEQKTRFTAVLEMILSIPSLDIVSLQEVTPSFLDLAQKHHSIQSEWVMTDCWDTEHQKERQGSGKGNIFLIKKRWASNIRAWVKKFPTSTMERFVVILDMFQGDASLVRSHEDYCK
jgi:endonuclease/exonuclease/phosphatase family metal-dependent hydrolase